MLGFSCRKLPELRLHDFCSALVKQFKENLSGFWSRRIDDANRLVYCVDGDDLVIIACRYHYDN